MFIHLTFITALTATWNYLVYGQGGNSEGQCVALKATTIPHCAGLGYNLTLMPNSVMDIDDLVEAQRRVTEFQPLFKIDCYKNLQYFICNMFAPVCHDLNGMATPVYPCRHVCEQARKGCEPLMTKYSFMWPAVLRCERLFTVDQMRNDRSNTKLCGSPPAHMTTHRPPRTTVKRVTVPKWIRVVERFPPFSSRFDLDKVNQVLTPEIAKALGLDPKIKLSMKAFCGLNPKFVYVKRDNFEKCLPKCDSNVVFTGDDKKFATVWISTWSIICFISTALTVTTFLIDHKRFRYPERPIIFLSFCYNLYSIGFLIRVFGGYDNVVCKTSGGNKHLNTDGMSVTACTLVFFFLYFFSMSSAIWWVILSLTWFLSAALKWGHEAIEKYSSIFHAVSWAIPTIQTILALVTRKVDADRLSGLCFIGNNSSINLLYFVVVPLSIYLALGTLFLTLGFFALIKIRKILRRERNTNKLERLMVRIGIFSVLYSVPASVVVGCFIHEYFRLKATEEMSLDPAACLKDVDCVQDMQPKPELFYLRYFMLLVVGVTSGVWIWSSKTLQSWGKFYAKCAGRKQQQESKRQLFKNSIHKENGRTSSSKHTSYDESKHLVGQPSQSLHGSQNHVHHQQPTTSFIPAPTRFYFPVQQPGQSFMQGQTVSIPSTTNDYSKERAVTPNSTITSSSMFNHPISGIPIMTNMSNPVPSSPNYSQLPSSTYSNSIHSSPSDNYAYGTQQRPSSPRGSTSTRSQKSTNGVVL